MVVPTNATDENVWHGNEAWPGCGGWSADNGVYLDVSDDSDSEDGLGTPLQEHDPNEGLDADRRRKSTWGQLRIITGATHTLNKVVSPKRFEQESLEDDVLTPRSVALRRVFGEMVESNIHTGSTVKRLQAFESAHGAVKSATISSSGTVMLDPRLKLEPISRSLFVKTIFDVCTRALNDPTEAIRVFAMDFIDTVLAQLRPLTFTEELAPLAKGMFVTMLSPGNCTERPNQIDRYEALVHKLVAEPMIGIKTVVKELFCFVDSPGRISGTHTHDWVLRLLKQLLHTHHILPAGEIPLEPAVKYALFFLKNSSTPASQHGLAMTLMTDLYKQAQKRLLHLISSLKPALHRKLTDVFATIDGQARGEARKRRPESCRSARPRSSNTAASRMSFLEGGEQPLLEPADPTSMTKALLLKSVKQRKSKSESHADLLMRVTHLHCNRKGIMAIDGLENTRKVQVLYLTDNYIPRIQNLGWIKNSLTHLYLQNNQITEMHGLKGLLNLSLIHISEPTRLLSISYAVFCLKKKKKQSPTVTNITLQQIII
eukprot:TRINITY_DN6998_c0_g1_i5.p1 TRINITY_DN6998_c0_g1~~TRINITY_DN6998_c0_g1_i5.p1  ORF type:complete len:543 (-),score=158.03 TRINITY_DN6998_c0_g1_i5:56-1684(-)